MMWKISLKQKKEKDPEKDKYCEANIAETLQEDEYFQTLPHIEERSETSMSFGGLITRSREMAQTKHTSHTHSSVAYS